MANYLVITKQNDDGIIEANLFSRDENPTIFDTLVSTTSTLTEFTANTILDSEHEYRALADSIEDTDFVYILRNRLGFRKCDDCGSWITPQAIHNGSSVWYHDEQKRRCALCARVYEEQPRNKVLTLSSYHSTSQQVKVINGEGENFTLDNVKGIGFEMEMNASNHFVRSGKFKCTDDFYKIANPRSRNRIFRCENDGSVMAEFISNVFTENAMLNFDYSILTNQLKLMGNDENYPSVGFHIHLSKTLLGETDREQALNFLKFHYILKAYESDWLRFSRRKSNEMSYCTFFEKEDIDTYHDRLTASDTSCMEVYRGTRYKSLISVGSTIELRIPKSSNDPELVKHSLILVYYLAKNLKNVAYSKCYCLGKIFKLVPSKTMNYWRKRGCFLNTIATDNRGFSL